MKNNNLYIFTHQKHYVHISFNSSFLHTLAYAFPDSHLNIYGYQSHIDFLSKEVDTSFASFFCFSELQIKNKSSKLLSRFLSLFVWIKEVIQIFRTNKIDKLIFLDIGRYQLYIIKILMLLKIISKKSKIFIIAHDTFEPLIWNNVAIKRFLNLTFCWSPTFKNNFCYIVLSKHIEDYINTHHPTINLEIQSLDHPAYTKYVSKKQNISYDNININPYFQDEIGRHINFAFIGTPQKGIDEFIQVANNVKENMMVSQKIQFFLAGYLGENLSSTKAFNVLTNPSIEPIGYDKYLGILSESHYVLWFAFHNPYQLRASGTIVEAIQLEKPMICLKNPLVNHYFQRFGNIGYCCDSLDEISKLIIEFSKNFPLEEYRSQIVNLRSAKNCFAPKYIAKELKKIVKSSC
jgi:glycosyltransferase involved in cell wall biosynthesis